MAAALSLARRGLGRVAPNPAVGCIIVDSQGHVAGRGWTQPGGRPHAETIALNQAGDRARGGCAYVTLEPCAHHGQTPPCVESLISSGIKRVVVATTDPDRRVNGKGLDILRQAGIEVQSGVLKKAADEVNAGFFLKVQQNRPLVTAKIASTLDGKIALANGKSQWITGAESRARGHALRAVHDAILTGIGTVLADDPALTCRLPGLEERSPIRVVLDRELRLPAECQLAQTAAEIPTWVMTACEEREKKQKLADLGIEVINVAVGGDGKLFLPEVMKSLAQRGITRLLTEGGGKLNASLIRSSLLDRLVWFRASSLIGEDGVSAVGLLGLEKLEHMPRFTKIFDGVAGADCWEEYRITY
tara:strand:- start:11413 stop:12492 length:1080 start_codon:yes stop_codon:yes gene_type:complete